MSRNLNGVAIIPTGLGCKLGGDAAFNSGIKLLAECCDNLIINPNSVNASDINELTDNCLYTEGSVIDRFLKGHINLTKVKTQNKILMVVNPPVVPDNINAMNAGIWGLGANIEMLVLDTPLIMEAKIGDNGTAGGTFSGADELIEQIKDMDFDILAIQTKIDCDKDTAENYWNNGGVNPWGGIEAIVSKYISTRLNKMAVHAPIEGQTDPNMLNLCSTLVVKRDMAPEIISKTYTFCILKGANRAPRVNLNILTKDSNTLSNSDIDFMVTPHGCWGEPHMSCMANNIPVIVVKENTTCFSNNFEYPSDKNIIFVENYLEAVGVIMSMSAGIDYRTVKVPVEES